jgi:hypothetical protein
MKRHFLRVVMHFIAHLPDCDTEPVRKVCPKLIHASLMRRSNSFILSSYIQHLHLHEPNVSMLDTITLMASIHYVLYGCTADFQVPVQVLSAKALMERASLPSLTPSCVLCHDRTILQMARARCGHSHSMMELTHRTCSKSGQVVHLGAYFKMSLYSPALLGMFRSRSSSVSATRSRCRYFSDGIVPWPLNNWPPSCITWMN